MKTLFVSIGHNRGKNLIKTSSGKWIKSAYPDTWASGNGTTEFAVTKVIVDSLVANGLTGIKVVKVPEGLNLGERTAWINSQLPNYPEPFALEFHLDSAIPTAKGASVWYNDSNAYTMNEGKQFLAKYTEITWLSSRHVNSDKTNRHGDLGFVSNTKCASLLIELGFISNATELSVIRSTWLNGVIQWIYAMNS